jgi:hypothetical protein
MRNPRQSRCAAAILQGISHKTAEAFGTKPEFGFRDFRRVPADPPPSRSLLPRRREL